MASTSSGRELLGPFLKQIDGDNFRVKCPGCGYSHEIAVGTPFRNGASWQFDGNAESPTFTPSLHCKSGHHADGTPPDECWLCKRGSTACGICHSFIRNGQWQFLADCTHHLAGQTVPMVPWGEGE